MNPATITRLRAPLVPGAVDRYSGDQAEQFDWDGVIDELPIEGATWFPIVNSENNDLGRQGVVIGWRVVVLNTVVDVTATDRVRLAGDVYRVNGEPARYEHPNRGTQVTELTLERFIG